MIARPDGDHRRPAALPGARRRRCSGSTSPTPTARRATISSISRAAASWHRSGRCREDGGAAAGEAGAARPGDCPTVGTGTLTVGSSRALGPAVDDRRPCRSAVPGLPVTERKVVALRPGGARRSRLRAAGRPGARRRQGELGVSRSAGLDVPSLLLALDRYPYGCAEQTTSRALPLLYCREVAQRRGLADDAGIRAACRTAIERVLSNTSRRAAASACGAPGSGDLWLDAYVTDFLTRAREKGYRVPDQACSWRSTIWRTRSYDADVQDRGGRWPMRSMCWRATGGPRSAICAISPTTSSRPSAPRWRGPRSPPPGSLRRQAARRQAPSQCGLPLAQGERTKNWSRSDYGSRLRDSAAMLALAAESQADAAIGCGNDRLCRRGERVRRDQTSTQENAWLLLAARAVLAEGDSSRARCRRRADDGNSARRSPAANWRAADDGGQSRRRPDGCRRHDGGGLRTSRCRPAATALRSSEPITGSTASRPTSAEVAQNERFVVVIKVDGAARLAVADRSSPICCRRASRSTIPKSRLQRRSARLSIGWRRSTPAHMEFRADRFVAAFDRNGADEPRGVHTSPMWSGRCRPAAMPIRRRWSRTCTGRNFGAHRHRR